MSKYIHINLNEKIDYFFPLANLVCIKSIFNISGQYEIYIIYKESGEHNFQIIMTVTAEEKSRILDNILKEIIDLHNSETKVLSKFQISAGGFHERSYTH